MDEKLNENFYLAYPNHTFVDPKLSLARKKQQQQQQQQQTAFQQFAHKNNPILGQPDQIYSRHHIIRAPKFIFSLKRDALKKF
jgi:hypothetical protein